MAPNVCLLRLLLLLLLAICCRCEFDSTDPVSDPPRLYLELVPDTTWEVALNRSATNCTEYDTTDSMPIAYHSPVSNMTHMIAAVSKGLFANTGPDLNHVQHNCSHLVFNSTFDWLPEKYANYQWVQSVHVFPNGSVFALIHNEFHGFSDQDRALGYCTIPRIHGNVCNMWSTGLGISYDGGQTFEVLGSPPNNRVFSSPYRYEKDQTGFGFGALSMLLEGHDGAFYGFVGVIGRDAQPHGICAFRSDNLFDPQAYRGWGGEEFNVTFADPYTGTITPTAHTCQIVDSLKDGGMHQSPRKLVWTTEEQQTAKEGGYSLPTYIMFTDKSSTQAQYTFAWDEDFSIAASSWDANFTTLDLGLDRYIHFGGVINYPTLLDSNSLGLGSVNFEVFSNQTGYMYINVRRDLWRRRVQFTQTPPVPPPPPPPPIPANCQSITVSGAGNETTNCVYTRRPEIIDDSPVFACNNSSSPRALSLYREEGIWRIALRNVEAIYAATHRNTTMPPTSGWRYYLSPEAAPGPATVTCSD